MREAGLIDESGSVLNDYSRCVLFGVSTIRGVDALVLSRTGPVDGIVSLFLAVLANRVFRLLAGCRPHSFGQYPREVNSSFSGAKL